MDAIIWILVMGAIFVVVRFGIIIPMEAWGALEEQLMMADYTIIVLAVLVIFVPIISKFRGDMKENKKKKKKKKKKS